MVAKKSGKKSGKKAGKKKSAGKKSGGAKKGGGKKGGSKKGGSKKGGKRAQPSAGKKLKRLAGDVVSAALAGAVKGAVEEVVPVVEEAAGVTEEDKAKQ